MLVSAAFSRYRAWCGVVQALALLFAGRTAWAQAAPPASVRIEAIGTCPTASDLRTTLQPLLAHTRLLLSEPQQRGEAQLLLNVSGATARVTVLGQPKVFAALPVDCAERARILAVHLALELEPLTLAPSAPPTSVEPARSAVPTQNAVPTQSVQPRPAPATAAVAPRQGSAHWNLAGGAAIVAPLGSHNLPSVLDFGANLRVSYGALWGLSMSSTLASGRQRVLRAEALPGGELDLNLWRIPLAVSLSFRPSSTRVGPVLEVGPELALLRLQASALPHPAPHYRLEGSLRLGAALQWRASATLAVQVGAALSWVPVPYRLRLDPNAAAGNTPRFWTNGELGLSWQ